MAVRTFDPQPIFMNVLPSPVEYAVDERIPEEGITCFLGKPGSGKTFATLDVACCKATGLNCWGQRVGPPQKVICIAAEAATAVKLRIIAWIHSHRKALEEAEVELVVDANGNESLPNLLLWSKAVNLNNPNEVYRAIKDIEELGLKAEGRCALRGYAVRLLGGGQSDAGGGTAARSGRAAKAHGSAQSKNLPPRAPHQQEKRRVLRHDRIPRDH
jgi:hypothetical protein